MSSTANCDRCDNPATVYLTEISNGKPHHFHLCQTCAKSPMTLDLEQSAQGLAAFKGRLTNCSFCGRSSRDAGLMLEGLNKIYICSLCVELSRNIFQQEQPMK